ncbi:hypothetical protein PAL_GLEAN10013187 [Pteropus alecto]|uniref:Uncharacterized protein n=1 Tax=Pteropus alecto TaxID=9402 RepID=L5KGQ9_PTEAL|nr:hypothetical protein PAL_GLEAN10013187 [Pteropus alecto]
MREQNISQITMNGKWKQRLAVWTMNTASYDTRKKPVGAVYETMATETDCPLGGSGSLDPWRPGSWPPELSSSSFSVIALRMPAQGWEATDGGAERAEQIESVARIWAGLGKPAWTSRGCAGASLDTHLVGEGLAALWEAARNESPGAGSRGLQC